jgi:hypothetical protein
MDYPHYLDDNDEIVTLPYTWEICSHCRGHGKSSAYLGAFTQSEMDEMGPDFREDYMSGGYDKPCDVCDGTGKVPVIDEARCKPDDLARYRKDCEDEEEYQAMCAAERRMGC